jgi:hypothetical protein
VTAQKSRRFGCLVASSLGGYLHARQSEYFSILDVFLLPRRFNQAGLVSTSFVTVYLRQLGVFLEVLEREVLGSYNNLSRNVRVLFSVSCLVPDLPR